jgi:hypothetical protein
MPSRADDEAEIGDGPDSERAAGAALCMGRNRRRGAIASRHPHAYGTALQASIVCTDFERRVGTSLRRREEWMRSTSFL